jgi:hypothetical protein
MFAVRVVAQDQQFHQRPSSIRGTVINGSTREPIGHALVYSQDNRFATWTDGDGHFEYPLPKTITDDASAPGLRAKATPNSRLLRTGTEARISERP